MIYLIKEDIKYLLRVAIVIALCIVAVRFFIYLLPYIIVGLVIMLIYDNYNKKKKSDKKQEKIQDAEIISERKG